MIGDVAPRRTRCAATVGSTLARRRQIVDQSLNDALDGAPLVAVQIAFGDHAMGQHRHGQPLDVVGHDVVAPFDQRQRLAGAIQAQSAAGAGAHMQIVAIARGFDQIEQVVVDRFVDRPPAAPRLAGR